MFASGKQYSPFLCVEYIMWARNDEKQKKHAQQIYRKLRSRGQEKGEKIINLPKENEERCEKRW